MREGKEGGAGEGKSVRRGEEEQEWNKERKE